MNEAVEVAIQAAQDVEAWLRQRPKTVSVQNVENDPVYQRVDVDLIWRTKRATYWVEIKGDRWDNTGNFFLETHSNEERNTLGCFLYTEADFVFYYFVRSRVLYILPMPTTRVWFLQNIETFRERRTSTPVYGGSHYTTVGRLVPIETVLTSVPSVRIEQL